MEGDREKGGRERERTTIEKKEGRWKKHVRI